MILCVGKLRERYLREAADEYRKRLTRYGRVEEIEIPDMPEPTRTSAALEEEVRRREGERLLQALRPGDYVIALCIEGKQYDSQTFATRMGALRDQGRRVALVIGGSLGLSEAVVARADERLSLSAMTFPHQLARVLLLEQLYRACKISANERYHK